MLINIVKNKQVFDFLSLDYICDYYLVLIMNKRKIELQSKQIFLFNRANDDNLCTKANPDRQTNTCVFIFNF